MANEEAVEWVLAHGMTELAEAVSYLLHQEFGHILRPSEDRAWYKAACGVIKGLKASTYVGGITYTFHFNTVRELINKGPEV
jgi:hypothetical protein